MSFAMNISPGLSTKRVGDVEINMGFRNLENPIEAKAVKEIWQELGIKGSKLTILGETGFPDRIFWLPEGKPFLIEFKRPGEKLRAKQQEIHDELLRLGYQVEVHDNVANALEAIINAVEATRLSKKGREILARARRRCAFLRSRTR